MFYTPGMEQGKRFLVWRKEERKVREGFPIISRQSHKTGIYQHLTAGREWTRAVLGANRSLRLMLIF